MHMHMHMCMCFARIARYLQLLHGVAGFKYSL